MLYIGTSMNYNLNSLLIPNNMTKSVFVNFDIVSKNL
ncbi:MAG: hypothetical protein PWQ20_997 [Thermotogaceae bacterium]|nr:hypothetical protein [Thermotogaceae bacterium]